MNEQIFNNEEKITILPEVELDREVSLDRELSLDREVSLNRSNIFAGFCRSSIILKETLTCKVIHLS